MRVAVRPADRHDDPAGRAAPRAARTRSSPARDRPDVNLLPGRRRARPATRWPGYLALPGKVPRPIAQLAQQLGEDVSSPYQRAFAIEQFLAEHYRLVGDAPSGHAYPNLDFFLFGPATAGGQKGTSEQFAAAFAVLARLLGLPTRVVVGFRADAGAQPVPGGDALAWPEVLFNGVLGAVRPAAAGRHGPAPDGGGLPPEAARVAAAAGDRAGAVGLGRVAVAETHGGPDRRRVRHRTRPPWSRSRREAVQSCWSPCWRSRRWYPWRNAPAGAAGSRKGTPAQRIDAAWAEVLTGLRLAGRPAPPHLTASEVARYAATAATGRAHSKPRGVATIRVRHAARRRRRRPRSTRSRSPGRRRSRPASRPGRRAGHPGRRAGRRLRRGTAGQAGVLAPPAVERSTPARCSGVGLRPAWDQAGLSAWVRVSQATNRLLVPAGRWLLGQRLGVGHARCPAGCAGR